ncbi:transglycosylase SLT domain-containing protein [Streptomyces bambusae]|uniref:aggregation-promoting factor C-terminal-like domain-containing protein n=1 Tax=Streptomyces bambusae TaxID=1550616 RepID=UPI001CFD452D|nr:transglycosylase SLT domain-containing protein [Streptomyces bambusae]MCB5164585.1 transglycosylase SLT domain-containing protein [Streptomyces bambusae]
MSSVPMSRFLQRKRSLAGLTAAAAVLVAGGALTGAAPAQAATLSPQTVAHSLIPNPAEYAAFSHIVQKESGWKVTARNASSGAYGLGQALPGEKMAAFGPDWRTNPTTQIEWCLNYMQTRYGSCTHAWEFWKAHHWY